MRTADLFLVGGDEGIHGYDRRLHGIGGCQEVQGAPSYT